MRYFILIVLMLISCSDGIKEVSVNEQYCKEDVTLYAIPDGLVVEYTSFWTNKTISDTLILDMDSDQLNGRLYWPGPYELRFIRK